MFFRVGSKIINSDQIRYIEPGRYGGYLLHLPNSEHLIQKEDFQKLERHLRVLDLNVEAREESDRLYETICVEEKPKPKVKRVKK